MLRDDTSLQTKIPLDTAGFAWETASIVAHSTHPSITTISLFPRPIIGNKSKLIISPLAAVCLPFRDHCTYYYFPTSVPTQLALLLPLAMEWLTWKCDARLRLRWKYSDKPIIIIIIIIGADDDGTLTVIGCLLQFPDGLAVTDNNCLRWCVKIIKPNMSHCWEGSSGKAESVTHATGLCAAILVLVTMMVATVPIFGILQRKAKQTNQAPN